MNTKANNPLLVLEIGCEEIPARFVSIGIKRLKESAERIFSEQRLRCGEIKTYGTPRRLALICEMEDSQVATEREVWGPPVHVAFDSNGNPTKAAEAFAKNNGISLDDLQRKEKNKGLYIVALIKEPSAPAEEILPFALQKLILSLSFPKAMRWGSSSLRFVRPIHWILALYNNKRISFNLEGIKSGNMTKGHRFLSPAAFEIRDARTYINLLRNNFVVLDQAERESIIKESSKKLSESVKATFIEDEELLSHVRDLVEFPQAMLGSFPQDYLDLPEELLITVMKGHQKYFALRDLHGNLTNHFVIISNTKPDNADRVTKGAQKVIKARFEDARFYYQEDKKIPLKKRAEELKKVVHHERLGSIYEKTQRIKRLACFIAERCCPDRLSDVSIASELCKSDLVSGVVREFPELQGVMGGYYARNEEYSNEIALAISEHYLPRFAGDRLPKSDTGVVISLADKIDNLVSFFSIGEIPSGTEDPFALRRQCYAVVSILMEKRYSITLEQIVSFAIEPLTALDSEALKKEIFNFFGQRFDYFMQTSGYEQDIRASLMDYVREQPLYSLRERAEALKNFKTMDYYSSLTMSIKRINNIAPKVDVAPLSPSLFQEDQERELYESSLKTSDEVSDLVKQERFIEALRSLNKMQPYINNFFDRVLVMDNRDEVRHNRLALIKSVQKIAGLIADFSKLV